MDLWCYISYWLNSFITFWIYLHSFSLSAINNVVKFVKYNGILINSNSNFLSYIVVIKIGRAFHILGSDWEINYQRYKLKLITYLYNRIMCSVQTHDAKITNLLLICFVVLALGVGMDKSMFLCCWNILVLYAYTIIKWLYFNDSVLYLTQMDLATGQNG